MNKNLILKRIEKHDKYTKGVLLIDGVLYFSTLELPWRENRIQISCIPEGVYKFERRLSPKFGHTFEVLNVPNRSEILFHAGNWHTDTHGCILVAEGFTADGIKNSRTAMDRLMAVMEGYSGGLLEIV